MTRLELQDRTLTALNELPRHPVYWALSEIRAYLNEAQEVMAEEVGFAKRTFTIPRRDGTQVYQLPGVGQDILVPYRVYLPDYKRRLEAKTLADLDARHERWLESPNIPECWVGIGWDQILIWPHETTPTGTLEINCYCWPTGLEDDDAVPELQPTSHEALSIYAAGMGALKQWLGEKAVERWGAFFKRYGHSRSQAGINRVQARFWSRSGERGNGRE